MLVSKDKFYIFLASLLFVPYAIFVTHVVFAWKLQSPGSDIWNYVAGYDRYIAYLHLRTDTWIDYITNELAFHLLYFKFSEFLGDPMRALQFLSGGVSVILFLALLPTKRSQLFYLVVLLHPRVLDLISSQIRFAIAITIFIFLIRHVHFRFRGLLVLPVATIHTFFLAASVFVLFFDGFLRKKDLIKIYIQAMLISIFLVFGSDFFLELIGDRRAGETEVNKSFGFAYLAMFTLTYGAIIYTNRNIVLDLFGFLFFLTALSAIFTAVLGGYAERYVTASILFFLAYCSRNEVKSSNLVFLILISNLALSLIYWL